MDTEEVKLIMSELKWSICKIKTYIKNHGESGLRNKVRILQLHKEVDKEILAEERREKLDKKRKSSAKSMRKTRYINGKREYKARKLKDDAWVKELKEIRAKERAWREGK